MSRVIVIEAPEGTGRRVFYEELEKRIRNSTELPEKRDCPFCGSNQIDVWSMGGSWYVSCYVCGSRTGRSVSMMKAIRLWNGEDNGVKGSENNHD